MSALFYSYKTDKNKKLSAHFKVKEFRCKDGSDQILIHPDLIAALEKLFDKVGCDTMNINSGYRTDSHSIKVGGYAGDQHTKGNAADIWCKKDGKRMNAKLLCCALQDLNHNGGVGYISSTAIHLDVRGKRVWFDETKNDRLVTDWYQYFGIVKNTSAKNKNKSEEKFSIYVVNAGDSFWRIAAKQMGSGLKYKELARYNNLRTSDIIRPGQKLKIPQ